MRKQLFLSHSWAVDEEGRDTHARARLLAHNLQRLGWSVWFDEYDMRNNIDASMANGIDGADTVLILLTRAYARKVNRAAQLPVSSNDNCLKEFSYAMFRGKAVLPIVFEERMRDPSGWSPGIVPMRLSMTLYVEAVEDDLHDATVRIHKALLANGMRPHAWSERIRRRMRQRSRTTPWMFDDRTARIRHVVHL